MISPPAAPVAYSDVRHLIYTTRLAGTQGWRRNVLAKVESAAYIPLVDAGSSSRRVSHVSSTVDRSGLAARSTDFEAIAEVFMPIRIRRHNNSWHETQVTEANGIIAALADRSTACYTGRKPKFRILYGSI